MFKLEYRPLWNHVTCTASTNDAKNTLVKVGQTSTGSGNLSNNTRDDHESGEGGVRAADGGEGGEGSDGGEHGED